jgi:VanZ family protein
VTQLFKLAAWCSLAALAVASWTPSAYMVRSGYSGLLEHAAAYAITATAFAVAYRLTPRWRIALALSIYAAMLEIGQTWVPGRGPWLADWAAGSLGAGLALALWTLSRRGSKGTLS